MKNVRFEWSQIPEISRDLRSQVEMAIRQTYSDRANLAAPCHSGMVTAKLGPTKAMSAEVCGSIVCSCGCEYCDLETSNGGEHFSFVMRSTE